MKRTCGHSQYVGRTIVVLVGLILVKVCYGFSLPLLPADGTITATFDSPVSAVSYDKPLVATLTLSAPGEGSFRLTDLRGRFRGFSHVEDFEAEQEFVDGRTQGVWRIRLTPSGLGPWRLLPFAVCFVKGQTGQEQTVVTQAVKLPVPQSLPEAEGAPECELTPEWVPPGWQTLSMWGLLAAGGLCLLAGLWWIVHRIRRTLHERMLSPEARAEEELARLLERGWIAQGAFDRFYTGLTGVVRRYFERRYHLRATRQTSEEFLAALTQDVRFSVEDRRALADFLMVADKIKFAHAEATAIEAEQAVVSAREVMLLRGRGISGETLLNA